MRKIIGLILVALTLVVATPAQAQLKFGIKGGLNLAKADFSGINDNFKTDNFTGFFIGPMVEFTLPIIGLGVDGALMFSQKGFKYEIDGESTTEKTNGLEVPINLKYNIGLSSLAAIYLAAGPSFYFNFSDSDFEDMYSFDTKKAELAINLGAGVKLFSHLQVGVNYNIGLSKAAEFKVSDLAKTGSYKNKTWQVSVAYIF